MVLDGCDARDDHEYRDHPGKDRAVNEQCGRAQLHLLACDAGLKDPTQRRNQTALPVQKPTDIHTGRRLAEARHAVLKALAPTLKVDGELQVDAALMPNVAQREYTVTPTPALRQARSVCHQRGAGCATGGVGPRHRTIMRVMKSFPFPMLLLPLS